jgi:hypothetical protein
MSEFAQYHRTESELLHKMLSKLHDDIYNRGLSRVRDALMALHKVESGGFSARKQCRGYIAEFETLREHLEAVMKEASDLRSKLVHENGCDRSCSDSQS